MYTGPQLHLQNCQGTATASTGSPLHLQHCHGNATASTGPSLHFQDCQGNAMSLKNSENTTSYLPMQIHHLDMKFCYTYGWLCLARWLTHFDH